MCRNTKLLVILIFIGSVYSESCLFDFERDEELGDFNTNCGGSNVNEPTLIIADKPATQQEPSEPVGNRGLTVVKEKQSCMVSYETIKMKEQQFIKVAFFVKRKQWSDNGLLKITVDCPESVPPQKQEWTLLDDFINEEPIKYPDGVWIFSQNEFSFQPNSECTVRLDLYKNNYFEIYVDKIEIIDPVSTPEQCYKVDRPTVSTTEHTDTTSDNNSSPTDSPDKTETTNEESDTTDPSDSTESTASETSDTNESSGTTQSIESTRETADTTNASGTAIESDDSTSEKTDATDFSDTPKITESTESVKTTVGTTESTTEVTENIDNITSGAPSSEESSSPPTPSSPTSTSHLTTRPPTAQPGYPEFSFFFIVIIIAVSGAMSLISFLLCYILHRRKRMHKKAHRNKTGKHSNQIF